MNRLFFVAAFAIGLAAVVWVGIGFVGSSGLALAMTAVIAGVYSLGAFELRRFRAATASMAAALASIPQPLTDLGAWLVGVHPSLRNAVRMRIEGERAALPGPALTPYLVGLLVMLGMLGTFLGMVLTFKGAVFALEGSTDLHAIRAALAAPIKGLGLAFGTSVAGVAASSMLGLLSALSRRERVEAGRLLDSHMATVLRPHSLAHQRQETYRALQVQATALPEVVNDLKALMDGMERRNQQLNEQLLASQALFHREVTVAYTGLAETVGRSLNESLSASARIAGESLKPVVEAAMSEIAQESKRLHERAADAAQTQLNGLATAWTRSLESMAAALRSEWQDVGAQTLAQQRALCETLEKTAGAITERSSQHASQTLGAMAGLLAQSEELARARIDAEDRWTRRHGERMDQLGRQLRTELGALRDAEAERGHAAVERLDQLLSAVAGHLATLGAALEAPMTRLIQTAAEVPQAAAGVLTQLRAEMSRITERDTLALQERDAVMYKINALLQTINQAAGEQRAAIESLAASASTVMDQASRQFADTLGAQAGQSEAVAAQVVASAVELSSLGESFNHGVVLFSASNQKLMDSLQRIDDTLGRSIARSDEQLAYYVAQAREVIDLSISAQQGVIEDLRRLRSRQAAPAERVAEGVAG